MTSHIWFLLFTKNILRHSTESITTPDVPFPAGAVSAGAASVLAAGSAGLAADPVRAKLTLVLLGSPPHVTKPWV